VGVGVLLPVLPVTVVCSSLRLPITAPACSEVLCFVGALLAQEGGCSVLLCLCDNCYAFVLGCILSSSFHLLLVLLLADYAACLVS